MVSYNSSYSNESQFSKKRIRRWTLLCLCCFSFLGCDDAARATDDGAPRLLMLGFDGLDPRLCKQLMAAGKLPHFSSLAATGSFMPLATSTPPQSPVAWSNVICGNHAGTHQIFDFIHRHPNPTEKDMPIRPFLSTSRVEPPASDRTIEMGQWRIPLSAGRNVLLRRGPTFWQRLIANGVDATIYRIPANYPPMQVPGPGYFKCLSGMGTPDLLGTYGEFTIFTPDAPLVPKSVAGGKFVNLTLFDHRGKGILFGPENPLRRPDEYGYVPPLSIDFEVVRDPQAEVAKITVGSHLILLNPGEWSDWLPIDLDTGLPGTAIFEALQVPVSVPAMVRFYAYSVHPKLKLYVSPINIDPQRPVTAISTPPNFSQKLAQATGRYYTTGIPEDAKAIRTSAFNEDEFLQQVDLVLAERKRQYRYALEQFESGFLFFYFGTPDLLSHIFWRDRDPAHPGRDPAQGNRYANVIDDCYIQMDALLGQALETLHESDTVIVLSDHGFTSFRRSVHLNTWLLENGYLALKRPGTQAEASLFQDVDWSKTRAYAFGINGLFVNQQGREKHGIVPRGVSTDALLTELGSKLLTLHDVDGSPAIAQVDRVDEVFPGADPELAPDLIIGYADNYRGGWSTALGGIPKIVFEDNLDRWSGDHCVAADLVPGVLYTNRQVRIIDPKLSDIAVTVSRFFEIEPAAEMTGRNLFAAP